MDRLLALCIRGLPRMRASAASLFAFTRIRAGDALVLRGESLRYTAIVLLGGRCLAHADQCTVFAGRSAQEFCDLLLPRFPNIRNLGDAALLAWALAESGHTDLGPVADHLLALRDADRAGAVVEHAWLLAALVALQPFLPLESEVAAARDRLCASCSRPNALFPHWLAPQTASRFRRHVGCFADQVYPIQALARDYSANGVQQSLDLAAACADRICALQGPAGQWWWHYDVRTGAVVEGYPVYTVHQDAMAPMALFDLKEAGGPNHSAAILRGMRWMTQHPEVSENLIEDDLGLIWRSVRRADPTKFVRKARAVATSLAPAARLRALDALFPPARVDYEDRPYHLGWILYAWLGRLQPLRQLAAAEASA